MGNHFGETLRELRQRAHMSLADLAKATNWSKPQLARVEVGHSRPTLALAEACDRALNTAPLLEVLCGQPQGDDVRRRALVSTLGLAATGAVAGFDSVAEAVRHGLNAAAGYSDWDELVAGHARDLLTAPGEAYGPRILADLNLLLQLVRDGQAGRDQLRAAAGLGNFFGLWNGNHGQLAAAHRWYRTAAVLADRSGDVALACYIRGYTATRATYEGATAAQTLAVADQILATTGGAASIGTLEAYSARATVAALVGDIAAGRAAVAGMRRVAERLPADATPWAAGGPVPRTLLLHAFVEGRCGTPASAGAAADEALAGLGPWPMWEAETHQYRARALVAGGDLVEGLRYALAAAKRAPHLARVIGVAVRDVIDQVPVGWSSPDLEELLPFASVGPTPWETIGR